MKYVAVYLTVVSEQLFLIRDNNFFRLIHFDYQKEQKRYVYMLTRLRVFLQNRPKTAVVDWLMYVSIASSCSSRNVPSKLNVIFQFLYALFHSLKFDWDVFKQLGKNLKMRALSFTRVLHASVIPIVRPRL